MRHRFGSSRPQQRLLQVKRLIGKMPSIAAMSYRHSLGFPYVLCFAKTPSTREITSVHNFLNSPICYDCSLWSAFSSSGW